MAKPKTPSHRSAALIRISEQLRERRKDKSLSQPAIADEMERLGHGISQGTVSNYEKRPELMVDHGPELTTAFFQAYKYSETEAVELAKTLFADYHSRVLQFLQEEPKARREGMRQIPVYSHISAGPGSDDGVIVDYIDVDKSLNGDLVAYDVDGHSMEPDIPSGSTIIVKRDVYQLGDIVAAWVPEVGMVVKRLTVSRPEDGAILASTNPDYGQLIARGALIIGKVVESRKRH